jgi:uncharacterized protein
VTLDPSKKKPAAKPAKTSRRRFLKAAMGLAVAGVSVGAYAHWVEPAWIKVVRSDLPVTGLAPAWDGLRVAFVADLHHYPQGMSLAYLAGAMRRVQNLGADLILGGGDYVNSADLDYATRAAGLFKDLSAPLGVYSCLGNHEYGIGRPRPNPPSRPLAVAQMLRDAGVRVLENEAVLLEIAGDRLWLAGVGDFWSGNFRPRDAMKEVPVGAANLTLCHNPDAAEDLELAGCGTILSGHTHGGQVQAPLFGPPILPVVHRGRYQGLHRVGTSYVYITKGLGCAPYKVRFNCRPEISLLTLRPAAE